MTCARSCGVSPTATNCTCSCRRRGRWRADRSPGSSPRADAIRMIGRRKRTACSSTTTKAASPPRLLDPEYGGFIAGPKNLALSLVAFELSWVDAGAATGSLASNLGLAPIHERGTPEQKAKYVGGAAPLKPGENRKQIRAAFALTEPIPFVGVETGMLGGKVRVAEWKEGQEPILQVEKRGRFITNMGFANVVTAAVDTDDKRIRSSCMIILEETDPGIFDRGTPTKKLVHQLSSTNDPILNLKVPAHRIVGGYTIKDGVIVPNFSHGDIIEAVFRRTRVTVGLMTAAKLISAVEPIILYHRRRFRGGEGGPGTPRYELGIQQKEDALHRLVDIWAAGEASASLGFEAARQFDVLDPLEKQKDQWLAEKKLTGRAALKELAKKQAEALELVKLNSKFAEALEVRSDAEIRHPRFAGECFLPRLQTLEHRPWRQHDARSRQSHGWLWHHGGLPGFPRPEMDGCPARSDLRRARGGATVAAFNHDDQRTVPCAIPAMDCRHAPHRVGTSRHRRLHARHRHGTLVLDIAAHARRQGCRRREALSQDAPGRDVRARRRTLLAARGAAIHPRRDRTGHQGRCESGARGWPRRHSRVFHRSMPRPGCAGGW